MSTPENLAAHGPGSTAPENRTVRAGDLVGLAEATDRLGMTQAHRSTVSMWASKRETNGFPDPVKTLRCGPVYSWPDILAWARPHFARRGVAIPEDAPERDA